MTGIQILARSYRDRNIPIPVTAGKNGIVPFFSYNVTRVSRKEHKIFTNIVIYKIKTILGQETSHQRAQAQYLWQEGGAGELEEGKRS